MSRLAIYSEQGARLKAPDFKCIRLFVIADGWVAQFTGSDIAQCPDFDQFVGQA